MTTKPNKALDAPQVMVQISYCPELGIYHYVRSDGDEFFFDDDKLEQSITLYLSQKKKTDAEFMALLTADARKHPHKIVIYEGDKSPRITNPIPHTFADDAKPGDSGGKHGKRS